MVQDKLSYEHCDKSTDRASTPYTKDVFMEHLHGNNMKKAYAFTMQHLLILNIL